MTPLKEFDSEAMQAFEPTAKVAFLSTINPQGQPHITLLNTLMAKGPRELVFGEFSRGLSKSNLQTNPKAGFLVLTMDRKMWRGTARWTRLAKDGPEYQMLNDKPMFRYNAYFAIHTVHYLDLVETSARERLPLESLVPALLLTRLAKGGAVSSAAEPVLNRWSEKLFNRLDSLKFVSWVGPDGFPRIVPALQCQAAGRRRLAFSTLAYGSELAAIPAGAAVAVFGMTFKMEDVLARGAFLGFQRHRGLRLGVIELDYLYNSMPPSHGQVYPPVPMKAVEEF